MAWTAPKTWIAETLTAADLNAQVRDNELYLKAHEAATSAQHGLPAGAFLLGAKTAAGLFLQFASATVTETGAGAEYTLTATWPVAFTTLVAYIPSTQNNRSATYDDATYAWTYGVTSVSCKTFVPNGVTFTLRVLGIGT